MAMHKTCLPRELGHRGFILLLLLLLLMMMMMLILTMMLARCTISFSILQELTNTYA